ncbi:MAG: putative endonuclease [Pirellulaceae bacterium]|jgi:putative endonuclease
MQEIWHFYLVRCSDDSLYSGICKDLDQRIEKHNQGAGAKYTRGRGPVELVHSEELESHSAALKREYAVKRWSKAKKLTLIAKNSSGENSD